MDMLPYYMTLGLAALALLLWIIDGLKQRQRRPRPPKFDLRPGDQQGSAPAPAEERSTPAAEVIPVAPRERSWLERLQAGLGKTRQGLAGKLAGLLQRHDRIDANVLEEVEAILLSADVGVEATDTIIQRVTDQLEKGELRDPVAVERAIREELLNILKGCEAPLQLDRARPYVILVVGVNGVGKTTTIGKLAKRFQAEGKKVMLAAGDTFRAAAVEQLQVWGERNEVPVIAQHTGADSASVIFDAVQAASSRGIDVVLADTAGRLQNKENLMQELEKVVRVMRKQDAEAPHEVLLVLDGCTGQNALSQVRLFREMVGVSGLAITKLDGTAKGGILVAIAQQHDLPIRFIGVGEGIDDLRPFRAGEFVSALFGEERHDGHDTV